MIIGLVGVIGSGKTYTRDQYVAKGFTAIDFKDALIEMAEDLVGFKITDYDRFKRTLVGLPDHDNTLPADKYPPHVLTQDVLARYPTALTGRVLLQRLGTECMRRRDPDYWVKQWAAKVDKLDDIRVVCADCRFPNEIAIIRSTARRYFVPSRIQFCNYKSDRYDATSSHESEEMAQEYLRRGYADGQVILE
jgi:hypothetical protein